MDEDDEAEITETLDAVNEPMHALECDPMRPQTMVENTAGVGDRMYLIK